MRVTQLRAAREQRAWKKAKLIHEMQRTAGAFGMPLPGEESLSRMIAQWENGHRYPADIYQRLLCAVYRTSREALGFPVQEQGEEHTEQDPDHRAEEPSSLTRLLGGQWSSEPITASRPVMDTSSRLILPDGRSFTGSATSVLLSPGRPVPEYGIRVTIDRFEALDRFTNSPNRGLLIGTDESRDVPRLWGLDSKIVRRRANMHSNGSATVSIPSAYQLDDLTYGILWATANLDDALLGDDAALSERYEELRAYEQLKSSAVSREAARDLSDVSHMWLGSDFCARHILRHSAELDTVPLFWTREQQGEEASMWLLFRHKYDYLIQTRSRFADTSNPLVREFCVPEDAVHDSPVYERVLFFLAAALIEALGIEIRICVEPELSSIPGFVLVPDKQAIIANWIRSEGIWQVDTVTHRAVLRELTDAGRYTDNHSVAASHSPAGRLASLALYLDLDWSWLRRRCRELGEYGCEGIARPRSRLLSTEGVNTACRFIGKLP